MTLSLIDWPIFVVSILVTNLSDYSLERRYFARKRSLKSRESKMNENAMYDTRYSTLSLLSHYCKTYESGLQASIFFPSEIAVSFAFSSIL